MIEMFSHIEKPENSVEDSTKESRMSLCRSCEHFTKMQICNKCACFMPLKTWFKISKCPLEKW